MTKLNDYIEDSEDVLDTPTDIAMNAFLLSPPFNIAANEPNNAWMQDKAKENGGKIEVDRMLAFNQWIELYHNLANSALVYNLPNTARAQDQIYTANIGVVNPDLDKPTFILSNFKSPPRKIEEKMGLDFFKLMNYDVYQPEFTFEGEADLKYVKPGLWIGGHGQRSDARTYEWMKKEFGMNIIPLKMEDEYLYHLDCMLFPLNTEKVMLCTELVEEETLAEIEKHVEIVDCDIDLAYQGIFNNIRNYGSILSHSNLQELSYEDEYYEEERRKVETLTKICANNGFEPIFVNISHISQTGGSLLSCVSMRLNYNDYQFSNT